MNYEQNITVAAVIIVTLVVLWYVDKEIKILRSDVVHMKEALSINVQMFQKLRNAYQSLPSALQPMMNRRRMEQAAKESDEEQKSETPSDVEEEKKESVVEDGKLDTIEEEECSVELSKESPKEPLASNDVPVQKEVVKKRGGRRKIAD